MPLDYRADGQKLHCYCKKVGVDTQRIGIVSWRSAAGCMASVAGRFGQLGRAGTDVDTPTKLDLCSQMNFGLGNEDFEMMALRRIALPVAYSRSSQEVVVIRPEICLYSDRRMAHHRHCRNSIVCASRNSNDSDPVSLASHTVQEEHAHIGVAHLRGKTLWQHASAHSQINGLRAGMEGFGRDVRASRRWPAICGPVARRRC